MKPGDWMVTNPGGKVAHCVRRVDRDRFAAVAYCGQRLYCGDRQATDQRRCGRCENREHRAYLRDSGVMP